MIITIDTVYPDKESNPILVEMFQIIDFRKHNQLKFIPKRQVKHNNDYTQCRRHHIIPKCYYKYFNIQADNSSKNLICLTHDEHSRVHELLTKYYEHDNSALGHYLYGCNKKAYILMCADNKTYKLSETTKNTWNNYSAEQRKQRCDNISNGTKTAMANIPSNIRQDQIKRAAQTLSINCAKRTATRKAELHQSYGKYHIGSKAMSNDITHHWRYVSKDEQQTYLQNGYVFGNHSKDWLKLGYVKISKGHYALQ